ncbi:MAG: DNA-binding response regulator [uncultured Sulfurovum sp.]|uniref:DNA-binding response regulator n=1 Tax=uncultured Sulfurovum sp. TaxID=269237 RepID=A0A6S6T567_9BACT|nr:MAG: DNA-binding response regulator [uncultured Sulfurovum sp.]
MSVYTLLYVEDDLAVRKQITEFLKRYYKEVYEASSAEEGLELYKRQKPHILLLDIHLGGMSGIELATLVRQKDKKTRILISTAYTNQEFMLEAIELDITRYLIKPMTSEELVKALEKCWQELDANTLVKLADGCFYNREKALLTHHQSPITLRHKEVEILEYFLAHEGKLVRYEMLEESIWEKDVMTRDAIRSQIRNIRKKLQLNLFKNVSGLGYKFTRQNI